MDGEETYIRYFDIRKFEFNRYDENRRSGMKQKWLNITGAFRHAKFITNLIKFTPTLTATSRCPIQSATFNFPINQPV